MNLLGDIDAIIRSDGPGTCRIGIMGGTFDPIHTGHLYCAEQAMDVCGLDAVVFIPAGNPSFKQGQRLAPIEERLKMCHLATHSNPRFFVSDIEAQENGVTYTVDTMRRLRSACPDHVRFEFIMGTDALLTLEHWHEAASLAALCGFICVGRPSVSAGAERVDAPCAVQDAIACKTELLRSEGFDITLVDVPLLDISSSDIRTRISESRSIRYLVPRSVCDYIHAKKLYRSRSEAGM